MDTLLCTFSGGRTSAFMGRYLQLNPKYENIKKVFAFANTGKEDEETLKFIDRCDKEWGLGIVWLETLIHEEHGKGSEFTEVTYETASRKGEPFAAMLTKYPMPTSFGSTSLRAYMRQLGAKKYYTAMGIRFDESHRRSNFQLEERLIYPLIDELRCDEKFIRTWWDAQPFDLGIKDYQGNCDLCFKKSLRKRLTMLKENPQLAEWWIDMEKQYGNENTPRFDLRNNKSMSELVELSKQPFNRIYDKHEIRKTQGSLFDVDLDYETDCFCKAT